MYLFNLLAKKKKNTIYNNHKDPVCQNLLAFSTFINDSDDPSVLPYFWKIVRISLNKGITIFFYIFSYNFLDCQVKVPVAAEFTLRCIFIYKIIF